MKQMLGDQLGNTEEKQKKCRLIRPFKYFSRYGLMRDQICHGHYKQFTGVCAFNP